jgi:hypothetical protein
MQRIAGIAQLATYRFPLSLRERAGVRGSTSSLELKCVRARASILLLPILAFHLLSLPALAATNPFDSDIVATPAGRIDEIVFGKLKQLQIQPAHLSTDPVFVRRAYLDTIGTLPTALEAETFILDTSPNKRARLIDTLLQRKEFAEYCAMRWSDVLRIKAEFPINLWPNAAQAYHRWILTALSDNMPYDQFVRQLLTSSGSNFRVGQVNFYRALQNKEPQGIAQSVALTLMGCRIESWPKDKQDGLAAFFSQVGYKSTGEWKEEIVFFDPGKATNGLAAAALFPDGARARLNGERDPREIFADWLIADDNPWFARNLVNRVWSWLLGRGIIHEPDDIRPDNSPSNPELLAYLESEFIRSHYDLRHLYRLILLSRTYQLSPVPRTDTPQAEAQFAHYPLRRLDAEVLIDAINQITTSSEKYTSPIPEPYTFIPENLRAIAIEDGSITSSFLELFGRSSRDTGLESERNNKLNAPQRIHLLNSSHIQQKIEQSRMIQYQLQSKKPPRDMAAGIYLGILSRFPTEAELQTFVSYSQSNKLKPREAIVDLSWSLINSPEFLYRH